MQETEEERAARLEARATAEKEAAIMREEAARQKLLERQKHEQVRLSTSHVEGAFCPGQTALMPHTITIFRLNASSPSV